MKCFKCKIESEQRNLSICLNCNTVRWSTLFLKNNLFNAYKNNLTNFKNTEASLVEMDINKLLYPLLENKSLFQIAFDGALQKINLDSTNIFYVNNVRVQCAYAVKLKNYKVKNSNYDFYVGRTSKHPSVRLLEHLYLKHGNLPRALAMFDAYASITEFVFEEGSNNKIGDNLEYDFANKLCNEGKKVWSDKHFCKKCR